MTARVWSPVEVADVRERLAAGETYREIGERYGASRNAVAGLVGRKCADVVRPERERSPRAPKPVVEVVAEPAPVAVVVPVAPAAPVVVLSELPLVAPVLIAFSHAQGCRWPMWADDAVIGEKLVCGASCGAETYCTGHAALAYRQPERRRAA